MYSIEEKGRQAAVQEMVVQSRSRTGRRRNQPAQPMPRERVSSEVPQRESCRLTPATSKLVYVSSDVLQKARQRRVHGNSEELVTGRSRSAAAAERLERHMHRKEENPDTPFLII